MNSFSISGEDFFRKNYLLRPGKKIFFASDFHLGAPNHPQSLIREKKIIQWLDSIEKEADAIFLVGDIFDFWYEFNTVVPKGFIRFQGKLAQLTDAGIPVVFFTGNHDLWMYEYFGKELNIPVFRKPQSLTVNNKQILVGHGDGLGPGDYSYKLLKILFTNPVLQWLFSKIHPDISIAIANYWSRSSRASNLKKGEDKFLGEDEWLWQYCKQLEAKTHHDFYIFGHRHLPLELEVNAGSMYVNLGEWLQYDTYACFDGERLALKHYPSDK